MNPHVKIQFEINSQQDNYTLSFFLSCESSRKNTIWNQFTTTLPDPKKKDYLVNPHVKIQFEINSQRGKINTGL